MQDITLTLSRSTTTTVQPEAGQRPSFPPDDTVPPLPEKKPNVDPFLVLFHENDPENPKACLTLPSSTLPYPRSVELVVSSTMVPHNGFGLACPQCVSIFHHNPCHPADLGPLDSTFASSAPSAMVPALMEQFHFSQEVGTLVISLFLTGYCIGPLVWGPLSEQYGRRPLFIVTFFIYTCFQVGCALAPNTASLLVFRFLGGTFAACPLTNSGALIGDIWDARRIGVASAIFAVAPFAGPGVGPLVAGYLVQSDVSWRWLFWILAIFAGVCCAVIVFTIPETYQPVILVKKAQRLRKQTGDERYYAAMEIRKLGFAQRLEQILARPFKVLFYEPMLIAVTVYMSFVYGCIYLLFEAYPIVFTEGHQMGPGPTGLALLPLPIGGALSVLLYIAVFNPRYERKIKEFAPNPVPPEYRLEVSMYAGPIFAIGFFWFGWTAYPSVSIWAPLSAGLLLGWGVCWIFIALLNYIIDAYLVVSASALAANTVVRSLVGAGFPLFANQMYDRLGPQWASSLLGFVALAMTPIPFVLFKYGPTLRIKSKYAPSHPPAKTSLV
ncbi:hypothetical protein ID866_2962 [Astraeus odoratus]|nr:hypothetical protein ID866_2962 [Astraeus odoratus]